MRSGTIPLLSTAIVLPWCGPCAVADSLKIIAVTLPGFFEGEAALVELMLRRGIWRVHVRKPGATAAQVAALIGEIAPELRPRLSVHYFPDVAQAMGTGLNLNAACPVAPAGFRGVLSRSCHSQAELANDVDYSFLSPIFNSISKPGYEARFDLDTLRVDRRTVALGGVVPENLGRLRRAEFGGAAMLGYLWADLNPETIKSRIDAAIYHSCK